MNFHKKSKKVAILGGGSSGLVAAKEALDNGLIPTIFEKHCDLGGVWNPSNNFTWNSLHSNVSKYSMMFSDTDWTSEKNKSLEMFPSVKSVFTYLNSYVDKWGIRKYIKFNADVKTVKYVKPEVPREDPIGSSGWEVTWMDKNTSSVEIVSEIFDGVIIATGICGEAFIPRDIKGLEAFPGKVIHSTEFKTGAEFKNQRVLVIGGSVSGGEVAAEVSNYAKETIHCCRDSVWVLERYLQDPLRKGWEKMPLDFVVFHDRSYLKDRKEKTKTLKDVIRAEGEIVAKICEAQQSIEALRIPSETYLNRTVTVLCSDNYLEQVQSDRIKVKKQAIKEIQGSKVNFEDEENKIVVDSIILATGFNICGLSPMFEDEVLGILKYDKEDRRLPLVLFKATMHPDVSNLYFVSMHKSTLLFGIEQQARWVCRLLGNKVKLPLRDVMDEGLKAEERLRKMEPKLQIIHFFDVVDFADEFAKLSGCFPDIKKLQDDDYTLAEALGRRLDVGSNLESRKKEICQWFMNQPVFPAHYNLVKDPEDAFRQMEFLNQVVNSYKNK